MNFGQDADLGSIISTGKDWDIVSLNQEMVDVK